MACGQCGHCGRRFVDMNALQSHQKAKKHGYCRKCNRSFAHAEAAEQHRLALHSFRCPDCNREFTSPEALQQHQKSTKHCYCAPCDRSFVHADAAEQHRLALHSFKCPGCKGEFVRPEALQQHQKSTKHCYCAQCDRSFTNPEALRQHLKSPEHYYCAQCNRLFVNQEALQQHLKSPKHYYCAQCNRLFVNQEALSQHLQSSIHATQFHCCDCDRDFINEQALHHHLADKIHKPKANPNAKCKVSSFALSDWVCEDCDRDFKDEKSLGQHRSSVIHKPLSEFKCFGHEHCKKRFTSPSAWLHHLESGACRSKITMESLNTAVRSSDVHQHITNGRNQENTTLKGANVSRDTSPEGSIILTPVTGDDFDDLYWSTSPGSASGILTPNTTISRRPSHSSSLALSLSCPLCPISRKPFKSLEALSNHLSSPVHSPKIFHCPLAIAGYEDEGKVSQLIKYFSTLSGLLQHLESGACQGGNVTFRKTVEYIEHNLKRLGLPRLRLLN